MAGCVIAGTSYPNGVLSMPRPESRVRPGIRERVMNEPPQIAIVRVDAALH